MHRNTKLWIALTFIMLSCTVIVIGILVKNQSMELLENGVLSKARVEKKVTFFSGGSKYPQKQYSALLIIDGINKQVNWSTIKEKWNELEKGESVDILYSGSDINNFIVGKDSEAMQRIHSGKYAIYGGVIVFVVSVFFLFLVVFRGKVTRRSKCL